MRLCPLTFRLKQDRGSHVDNILCRLEEGGWGGGWGGGGNLVSSLGLMMLVFIIAGAPPGLLVS